MLRIDARERRCGEVAHERIVVGGALGQDVDDVARLGRDLECGCGSGHAYGRLRPRGAHMQQIGSNGLPRFRLQDDRKIARDLVQVVRAAGQLGRPVTPSLGRNDGDVECLRVLIRRHFGCAVAARFDHAAVTFELLS